MDCYSSDAYSFSKLQRSNAQVADLTCERARTTPVGSCLGCLSGVQLPSDVGGLLPNPVQQFLRPQSELSNLNLGAPCIVKVAIFFDTSTNAGIFRDSKIPHSTWTSHLV